MIEVQRLTKRYGRTVAVDGLSFTVQPGVVTGFLGPNGSGKSTTMRMILGLDRPTSGRALVDGRPYRDLRAPARHVGALLEARAIHTGRNARNHLLALAHTHGVPARRVDEVIDLVGLRPVATKRAGGFSLGMGQRLGIASALLADPSTLILDEPVNGLDPEGIRWIRDLLRGLAAEGRAILISSHLMSEMALTATHLVVIGRGRLIQETTVADFVRAASGTRVRVRSPQADALTGLLLRHGATVQPADPVLSSGTSLDALEVGGLPAERIADLASAAGLAIYELTPHLVSLEEAFMDTTRDSVEYAAAGSPVPHTSAGGAR